MITLLVRLQKRLLWLLLAMLLLVSSGTVQAQSGQKVVFMQYEGAVTPAMLTYLQRGLVFAEGMQAEAVIFAIDTPGGSVDITRQISQAMQQSTVPVIVYVYPARAWAASAGTIITLSGNLAAMAPETFIGAASPVSSSGADLPDTAKHKEEEALAALARSLAERRGAAAVAWAAETVLSAQASTAEEALAVGAIDVIARDVPDLLSQLDQAVVVVQGQTRTLHLADAGVETFSVNWIEKMLRVLSNPAVAAILLTLGLNAILYELSAPGGYVAGGVGVISLILAFYSLGTLEANYAGLAFIAVAFILFIVELKAHTGGILTAAGVGAFVLGSAILFNTPFFAVPWATIIGLALAMGLFVALGLTAVLRTQKKPPVWGGESLTGRQGQAHSDLDPEGMVYVMGELWGATAVDETIASGEAVVVVGRQGNHLSVRRLSS
ncbi:MAG: nodulation protein NfeD [Chloroflexi bacterium]|nr:nodulation protein NfeD [Chloroflexota bacterium]